MSSYCTITALYERLRDRDPVRCILVDVRSQGAFHMGHMPHARSIPLAELPYQLGVLKKYAQTYIYGFDDSDTRIAADILEKLGYNDITVILGGWRGWEQQIGIIEKNKKKLTDFQQMSVLLLCLGGGSLFLGQYVHPYAGYMIGAVLLFLFLCILFWEKRVRAFLGKLPRNKEKIMEEQTIFSNAKKSVHIKQFSHTTTPHFSYAVRSDHTMCIVDPDRDSSTYISFAQQQQSRISAIVLTHTHCDFVGGHTALAEFCQAPICAHTEFTGNFPYEKLSEGSILYCGDARVVVMETPGHTDDSISLRIQDQTGNTFATLIGDAFDVTYFQQPHPVSTIQDQLLTKESRCHRMYRSIKDKLMQQKPDVLLFPTHTVMSLRFFSVADQLYGQHSIAKVSLESFAQLLDTHGQDLRKHRYTGIRQNKAHIPSVATQQQRIPFLYTYSEISKAAIIIDTRSHIDWATYYVTNSVNIPLGDGFATTLGTVVGHDENRYAIAQNTQQAYEVIAAAASIGYDQHLAGIVLIDEQGERHFAADYAQVRANKKEYCMIDIRSHHERNTRTIVPHALHIPLADLRKSMDLLPAGKHICIFATRPEDMHTAYSIIKQRFPLIHIILADDKIISILQ